MSGASEPVRSSASLLTDWRPAPAKCLLEDRQTIHIWRIDLNHGADWPALKLELSPDERTRAERFRFERHQRRFTVCRAAVRNVLAGYVGMRPREICFRYGAKGKPYLDLSGADVPVFNVTHSDELALLAVGRAPALGVDVEAVERKSDIAGIARRFFARRELEQLDALPPERYVDGFYHCWTRKEAYIKALGDGLAIPLTSFGVSVVSHSPAPLHFDDERPAEVPTWTFTSFVPAPGFIASAATNATAPVYRFWSA